MLSLEMNLYPNERLAEQHAVEDNPQVFTKNKGKNHWHPNQIVMRLPVLICDETSNMFNRLTVFLYPSIWILICYVVMSGVCSVELYQRSCALSCKVPQARSMLVADLVNTTLKVRPYMTVLHRCDDGSGCCQEGKTCQVKHFDDLEVKFPTFINGRYVLRTYMIRNHTECSCQSCKNNIKR